MQMTSLKLNTSGCRSRYGNGSDIPVELDEEGYIKYLVPLSEIGEGSHLLGLRTKIVLVIGHRPNYAFL